MPVSCGRGIISYGGLILNRMPYVVDDLQVYSSPKNRIERTRLLRHGSAKISSFFEEKNISIDGRIVAAGRGKSAMENALDKLKKYFGTPNQILKVGYDDLRYYQNTEIEDFEANWAEDVRPVITWNASILASDPFAYSETLHVLSDTYPLVFVSGSSYEIVIDWPTNQVRIDGTIFNWPLIEIEIPAATSYGITALTFRNLSTGQSIIITQSLVAGDVVTINSESQVVTKNFTALDIDGQFPYLDPRIGDSNSLEISAIATSAPTLNMTLSWLPRYL